MGEGEADRDRLGLDRPELRAWAMYDWANSAFMTTIIAAVFPVYFASVAAKGLDPNDATFKAAAAEQALQSFAELLRVRIAGVAQRVRVKTVLPQ